jgi:hypothetical protein
LRARRFKGVMSITSSGGSIVAALFLAISGFAL